jgi:L-rhamnose-H+ transport protein
MSETAWIGMAMVLVGGAMTGSFALPMKVMRRWEWENTWLVYSVVGLLLLPWIAAFATCPSLGGALGATSAGTLWLTAFFGFGWGVANVLFGLSVGMIGMALTFAIVSGMSAAFGSLLPLILLTPERLGTTGSYMIFLGVALTVGGVAALGKAGRMREKAKQSAGSPQSMRFGLLLCIVSGLLAPMLNFGFVFGASIASNAVKMGATQGNASNAIWAISLTGGFVANGGYAALKLFRSGAWVRYRKSGLEWALGPLTGVLFTVGFLLYGRGATIMGDLGPSVGWPVFQATTILVSTRAGALSGEWRNSGARIMSITLMGLVLLVSAIVVLSVGNRM